MQIKINGREKEFSGNQSLQTIIQQIGQGNPRIIAEVNGDIIKSTRWNMTKIKDGDTIELVSFVGGG